MVNQQNRCSTDVALAKGENSISSLLFMCKIARLHLYNVISPNVSFLT